MTNLIIHIVFSAILIFTIFLAIIDLRKPRSKIISPRITFIVPCYNVQKTIVACIESIYNSYQADKIELIAINDCSTDVTLHLLQDLADKYKFKVIDNPINLGKTKSINNVWRDSTGELIWIIDADVIINAEAVDDCLRRLADDTVVAVGCRCETIKNGVLSWMVGFGYNMLSITNAAYNVFSPLSIWGACSVYKRSAWIELDGLKENMIGEDMDSALRLSELGLRVEQSFNPVLTAAPSTIRQWYRQTLRWSAGTMQNFLTHPMLFIKNPLAMVFTIVYAAGIFLSLAEISYFPFANIPLLGSTILFILMSSPYLLLDIKQFNDIYYVGYLIIFVIVYYPIFTVVSFIGLLKGLYAFVVLRQGRRAW